MDRGIRDLAASGLVERKCLLEQRLGAILQGVESGR